MTDSESRNVLITGASGMIGSALSRSLTAAGYAVYALNRESATAPFSYSASTGKVTLDPAIQLHAVINLAGPSLAARRWSKSRKAFLLKSRTDLTEALATAIANAPAKPALFLSASAIGYYGLTGDAIATENSPAGHDFLALIATQWEQATKPAEQAGVNTIHCRFGVVLSKHGGMLQQLLLPYKLGLGGPIGNGKQYLSWITLSDVVAVVQQLLETNPASGPLNLVTDHPVTNADFSAELGRSLHRPSFLPMPAPVARLLFGEMADALLLGSTRVQSVKLADLGIALQHPTLSVALRAALDE